MFLTIFLLNYLNDLLIGLCCSSGVAAEAFTSGTIFGNYMTEAIEWFIKFICIGQQSTNLETFYLRREFASET